MKFLFAAITLALLMPAFLVRAQSPTCSAVVMEQVYDSENGTHENVGWARNAPNLEQAVNGARRTAKSFGNGERPPYETVMLQVCDNAHYAIVAGQKERLAMAGETTTISYYGDEIYYYAWVGTGQSENLAKQSAMDGCHHVFPVHRFHNDGSSYDVEDCRLLASW